MGLNGNGTVGMHLVLECVFSVLECVFETHLHFILFAICMATIIFIPCKKKSSVI